MTQYKLMVLFLYVFGFRLIFFSAFIHFAIIFFAMCVCLLPECAVLVRWRQCWRIFYWYYFTPIRLLLLEIVKMINHQIKLSHFRGVLVCINQETKVWKKKTKVNEWKILEYSFRNCVFRGCDLTLHFLRQINQIRKAIQSPGDLSSFVICWRCSWDLSRFAWSFAKKWSKEIRAYKRIVYDYWYSISFSPSSTFPRFLQLRDWWLRAKIVIFCELRTERISTSKWYQFRRYDCHAIVELILVKFTILHSFRMPFFFHRRLLMQPHLNDIHRDETNRVVIEIEASHRIWY